MPARRLTWHTETCLGLFAQLEKEIWRETKRIGFELGTKIKVYVSGLSIFRFHAYNMRPEHESGQP